MLLHGPPLGDVAISRKDGVSSGRRNLLCDSPSYKSIVEFRRAYQNGAPDAKRIKARHNKFLEYGSALNGHRGGGGGGWQRVSDEKVVTSLCRPSEVQGIQFCGLNGNCRRDEQLCLRLSESGCVSMCTRCTSAGAGTTGQPQQHNFACDMLDRSGKTPTLWGTNSSTRPLFMSLDRICDLIVPGYRSRSPGSIPGATRFSEKQWVWNGVHSASWVQLRSYLEENVAAPV
jgi:hypothetical protein